MNRVPKWTPSGTNLGDSRIEDAGGNLPVGVNTPGGYVYVAGQPGIEATNSVALLQTRLLLRDQSDAQDVQGFVDGRTSPTTALSALQIGTITNHPITFFSNGTHMGRWSTAGNLGIGTTAGVDPTTRLQIDNATTTTGSILVNQTGAYQLTKSCNIIQFKFYINSIRKRNIAGTKRYQLIGQYFSLHRYSHQYNGYSSQHAGLRYPGYQ
ncbi:MAG: hypothetical protein U0U70_14515 [Chitinophagaceae bacterium]